MNDRNRELLFGDDDVKAVITLTDEDGNDMDTEVIAAMEVEELGKEYIAVLPQDAQEGEEVEAMILGYSEDDNGDPVFAPVEDEEEFGIVSEAFNQVFEQAMDEDDEEASDGGFLDDIGDIIPGVSIQK